MKIASLLPPFRSICVRRIPVNCVNVFGCVTAQALRGIFDDNRRPLDAEVSGASLFGWAAPRKPGLSDVSLNLFHLCFRAGLVHDANPFTGEVEQHLALLVLQRRALDSFRLDGLSIAARPEYEVMHLEAENRLLALRFIQRIHERKRLFNLAPKRLDCLAFKFENGRLYASMSWCEGAVISSQRHIETEMVPTELNHPRPAGRWLAQKRYIILIAAEHALAALFLQRFVAF